MSDEIDQASTVEESTSVELHPTFNLPKDHPALKALEEARRDAASKRIKLSEERKGMEEKAKSWEDSKAEEFSKIQQQVADLEKRLSDKEKEAVRKTLINKYGLEVEDEEFLTGTLEQMEAKAKRLAERTSVPPNFLGGDRGKPVTKEEDPSKAGAALISDWAKRF